MSASEIKNPANNHAGVSMGQADIEYFNRYGENLLFIDPDSPRHLDAIATQRCMVGKDTVALSKAMPNESEVVDVRVLMTDNLQRYLDERFGDMKPYKYMTDGMLRIMYIESGTLEFLLVFGTTSQRHMAVFVGDEETTRKCIAIIEEDFKTPKSIEVESLNGFSNDGTAMISTRKLVEDAKTTYLAKDEFYPFMDCTIDELVQDYLSARAPILFLIGAPGTGKSTLLRTLAFKMGMTANVAVSDSMVIQNPGFVPFLSGMGSKSLIMMEDADKLCAKRESGNDQMSGLLNIADGICFVGNKIVISTNLASLHKVDEALYRDGRTFKIIEFRKLTLEEANIARQSIGYEPVDFGKLTEVGLGTAMVFSEKKANKLAPAVGFSKD